MYATATHQDRLAARNHIADIQQRRKALAALLRLRRKEARATARDMGRATGADAQAIIKKYFAGENSRLLLSEYDRRAIRCSFNARSQRSRTAALKAIAYYETRPVYLAGLPCGQDDYAYMRACRNYAIALETMLATGGRPLPR